jgi:hypothetical protein
MTVAIARRTLSTARSISSSVITSGGARQMQSMATRVARKT